MLTLAFVVTLLVSHPGTFDLVSHPIPGAVDPKTLDCYALLGDVKSVNGLYVEAVSLYDKGKRTNMGEAAMVLQPCDYTITVLLGILSHIS